MENSELTVLPEGQAEAITTRSREKYLLRSTINNRNFFCYMWIATGKRHFSEHELTRGKYHDQKEWKWAIEKWPNAKVITLTGAELTAALWVATEAASDFTFEMSAEQISKLPKDHATKF